MSHKKINSPKKPSSTSLDLAQKYNGEKRAVKEMRKFLAYYLKSKPGASHIRQLVHKLDSIDEIKEELRERKKQLKDLNKLIEEQRISQRTLFDLEMMQELGYCSGIENYSRKGMKFI